MKVSLNSFRRLKKRGEELLNEGKGNTAPEDYIHQIQDRINTIKRSKESIAKPINERIEEIEKLVGTKDVELTRLLSALDELEELMNHM